jgi:hypothetical protein
MLNTAFDLTPLSPLSAASAVSSHMSYAGRGGVGVNTRLQMKSSGSKDR